MEDFRHWHAMSADEVMQELRTSPAGLKMSEVRSRQEIFGPNELLDKGGVDGVKLFLQQFRNPLNMVLAAAAIVSFVADHAIDTVVIIMLIAFNAIMGFVQEYKAEKAIESLRSMSSPEVDVVRICSEEDGEGCYRNRVKAIDLVPGDIILLESGDRCPADCRLIEASALESDESFLTGESTTVSKGLEVLNASASVEEMRNMVFSGAIITKGRGMAVVVATGMETEMGRITELIREADEHEAPIEKRIKDLSLKMGLIAVIASILIFSLGYLHGLEFYEILSFSLAAAVSAIPEGLLVVLTIILSVGAFRMSNRNALIRKLNAVETLGSVTVICSDKTGTLTTNQMTVRGIHVHDLHIEISGAGYGLEGDFSIDGSPASASIDDSLHTLLQAVILCNDAKIREYEISGQKRWEPTGDPTEMALLVAAAKGKLDPVRVQIDSPRLDELPFDSSVRYMVTFNKHAGGMIRAYAKGSPESIIELSRTMMSKDGILPFTDNSRNRFSQQAMSMASDALRVLGVAFDEFPEEELNARKEQIASGSGNLTFLGLTGMIDPPRPEAKESVRLCHQAGIRVIMSTGDHRSTAEAIAKELGIGTESGKAYTGAELEGLSDDELDIVVQQSSVFSRVSPEHKNRIVMALKRNGHVVAMTGDGVNDAPALKAADVGIAMGINGTDVTKEVADMVLTDDNFTSIVNAVEEGRVVFENVRKVVQYLITSNVSEIILLMSALLFFPQYPLILLPIMILWTNLVTDGFFDKTLALEGKEGNIMERPPRDPDERITDGMMYRNILILGVLMAVGTLYIFTQEMTNGDLEHARTLAFVTLGMFQVWNAINCRSRTVSAFRMGIQSNRYFFIALLGCLILIYLSTELAIFQVGLGTVSLGMEQWAVVTLVSSSALWVEEGRKFIESHWRRRIMGASGKS
ncbi:MAG: HAD-IC family P-type ATPase [Candidatus Methanomethylophilaceae archaeon]